MSGAMETMVRATEQEVGKDVALEKIGPTFMGCRLVQSSQPNC